MALPDITKYTPEELADLLNACINEQERRANRDRIPAQIEDLRQKYLEAGGDPADLEREPDQA